MSLDCKIIKSLTEEVEKLQGNVAELQKERVEHVELIAQLRYESELAVKALTKNAATNN